jgi:ATP-dependent 26S proteasome regulatory subunit
MAEKDDVTFIPCVATGFVTKYQGCGPESIRTLFKRARRYAPAVIFIDEMMLSVVNEAKSILGMEKNGTECSPC